MCCVKLLVFMFSVWVMHQLLRTKWIALSALRKVNGSSAVMKANLEILIIILKQHCSFSTLKSRVSVMFLPPL